MTKKLVSIVIPTRNSGEFLENCLKSIKKQSYKNIETIIVDGNSVDDTIKIARRYGAKIYNFFPKLRSGTFDAPHKRNFGVQKAKGEFVYYLDADMELSGNVVKEAVDLLTSGFAAVIIKEDSFGVGIWASAKNLERRCYWGDDAIEAPRFFKGHIWDKLGGLDEELGGGGDDWDLYQKLLENGYRVARAKAIVNHNEGNLKLSKLIKKRFMYGRDSFRYVSKRPVEGVRSYFPIRMAYIKNWKLFLTRPFDTCIFLLMRGMEYLAGFSGVLYSFVRR